MSLLRDMRSIKKKEKEEGLGRREEEMMMMIDREEERNTNFGRFGPVDATRSQENKNIPGWGVTRTNPPNLRYVFASWSK